MKTTKNIFLVCGTLFLILGVVLMAGCSSNKSITDSNAGAMVSDSVVGDWVVLSVLSDGVDNTVPAGVKVTFSVDKEKGDNYVVYGFAGVNNYNVSVKIDGSDFVCGDIAVTLMAGDSAAENFERVFLNVLQNSNVITMSADSNGMVIGDASGKNAVILARQGLEGSNWTLVSYNLGSALETLTEGLNEPKLNIGLEGAVSGYTGINYITGIYKINNEKRAISFSQLVVTRMASPDEEASVLERNYLDLLEKVDAYQVSGNTLRLLNKDGMTLLTFIKD